MLIGSKFKYHLKSFKINASFIFDQNFYFLGRKFWNLSLRFFSWLRHFASRRQPLSVSHLRKQSRLLISSDCFSLSSSHFIPWYESFLVWFNHRAALPVGYEKGRSCETKCQNRNQNRFAFSVGRMCKGIFLEQNWLFTVAMLVKSNFCNRFYLFGLTISVVSVVGVFRFYV